MQRIPIRHQYIHPNQMNVQRERSKRLRTDDARLFFPQNSSIVLYKILYDQSDSRTKKFRNFWPKPYRHKRKWKMVNQKVTLSTTYPFLFNIIMTSSIFWCDTPNEHKRLWFIWIKVCHSPNFPSNSSSIRPSEVLINKYQ